MTTLTATTTAELIADLHAAVGGDRILLAPGTYSGVALAKFKFNSAVTITSADPTNMAVLTDLSVKNCKNLTFSNLEMSTVGTVIGTAAPKTIYPFLVAGSSSIKLTGINMHGDPNGTLATDVSGLVIENCTSCSVTNSSFQHLHDAIDQVGNTGLIINGNSFFHIWTDGIRGGGSSNVTISGNSFSSFRMDPTDPDHPDLIQFWTTGTTTSAKNIKITNNTYVRGDGNAVQGIDLRDEVGNIPYYNVTITGNTLTGAEPNGIVVYDAIGFNISNNKAYYFADMISRIGAIGSTNGKIVGNTAYAIINQGNTNLTLTNNIQAPPLPLPPPPTPAALTVGGLGAAAQARFISAMASLGSDPAGGMIATPQTSAPQLATLAAPG